MSNTATAKFLSATDSKTKLEILGSIASHYGITQAEAFAEIAHSDAEPLLEYLTGTVRAAVSLIMTRHGFAA